MKKILNFFLVNSNALLIFISMLMLVLVIHISLESNRKAGRNLIDTASLYTRLSDSTYQANENDIQLIMYIFSGTYFGKEGALFADLLKDLRGTPATKVDSEKIMRLISQYQQTIKDRLAVFDILFYFLLAGIAIQFVILLISIQRTRRSNLRFEQSKQMLKHLNRERENEYLLISSHLHDSILQNISSLLISPAMKDNHTAASHLREISGKIRDLTYQIAPIQLNTVGFKNSLLELASDIEKKDGIKVTCSVTGYNEKMLDREGRLAFYRICQTVLTAIKKQTGVKRIFIKLVATHPYLYLRIKDDRTVDKKSPAADSENAASLEMMLINEQAESIGAALEGALNAEKASWITLKYRIEAGE